MADKQRLLEIASIFIVQNGNKFVDFYSAHNGNDLNACNEAERLYIEFGKISDNSNF